MQGLLGLRYTPNMTFPYPWLPQNNSQHFVFARSSRLPFTYKKSTLTSALKHFSFSHY